MTKPLRDITKKRINKSTVFLLFPLIYILPGVIYSTTYTNINWLALLVLFSFILINEGLEYKLDKQQNRHLNLSLIFLELGNLALIIYFYINQPIFLGNIFVLYSILIQIQYLFKFYQLHYLAIVLLAIFKVFLLNGVSFYLNTNFITLSIFIVMLPYFIPKLLSELMRWKKTNPFVFISLLLLSYIVGIITLWRYIDFWSLLLLLTLPSAYKALNKRNYINTQLFTLLFSLTTLLLITFL